MPSTITPGLPGPMSEAKLRATFFPQALRITYPWGETVRQYIDALAMAAATIRDDLDAVIADRDLSDAGKARKRHGVAVKGIARIRDNSVPSLGRLTDFLQERLTRARASFPGGKEPSTPNEIRVANLAVDRLAGMKPVERFAFVQSLADDASVYFTLEHTPAALMGMKDDERQQLLRHVRQAAAPEITEEIEELERAIVGTASAESKAVEMVAQLGGLRRQPGSGEWAAPEEPEPTRRPAA